MSHEKFPLRKDIPKSGEHTNEILREAGYQESEISAFIKDRIVSMEKL